MSAGMYATAHKQFGYVQGRVAHTVGGSGTVRGWPLSRLGSERTSSSWITSARRGFFRISLHQALLEVHSGVETFLIRVKQRVPAVE